MALLFDPTTCMPILMDAELKCTFSLLATLVHIGLEALTFFQDGRPETSFHHL